MQRRNFNLRRFKTNRIHSMDFAVSLFLMFNLYLQEIVFMGSSLGLEYGGAARIQALGARENALGWATAKSKTILSSRNTRKMKDLTR